MGRSDYTFSVLTDDELERILRAARESATENALADQAALGLLSIVGMLPVELEAMRVRHVQAGYVFVPRFRARHGMVDRIPIPKALARVVEAFEFERRAAGARGADRLFGTRGNLCRRFKRYALAAGVLRNGKPPELYTLRHTALVRGWRRIGNRAEFCQRFGVSEDTYWRVMRREVRSQTATLHG